MTKKYLPYLPFVVLVALPTMFYWRIMFLGEVVYWGTPLLQFYPWRKLAVEIYQSGQIPLWNPYLGFGAPLAANLQSAVFYPLNFFYLMVPVERAMGYSIVLHVGLAGVFMYLLGRVLGMSTSASLLAAVTYMFSGYIVSRAHFISIVSAVPWLPLLTAASEGLIQSKIKGRGHETPANGHFWGWMALLSVATSMLLLAGHVQVAFYSLLSLCLYVIFRVLPTTPPYELSSAPAKDENEQAVARSFGAAQDKLSRASGKGSVPGHKVFWSQSRTRACAGTPKNENGGSIRADTQVCPYQLPNTIGASRPAGMRLFLLFSRGSFLKVHLIHTVKLLFVFGLALASGIALAGIQLIPTAELSLHSVRSSGAEYDFALGYSLWPWQIIGAIFPTLMGHPGAGGYWGPGNFWENAMYIGAVPLLLAVTGAVRKRGRLKVFLVSLAVVSVILSLGYYTPVYPWVFNHVPGFGLFQAPSRLLFLYTFSVSILCGFGLDAVKENVPKYLLRLGVAGGCAVSVMAAALSLIATGVGPVSLWTAFHISVTGLIFFVSCILLLKYGDNVWSRAVVPLTALVFIELFMYGEGLNPTTSAELYTSSSSGIAKYLMEDRGLHRVYTSEEVNLKNFLDNFHFKDWGTTDWQQLAVLRDQLPPGLSSAYGVFESYNYDPLRVRRASRLMAESDRAGLPSHVTMAMNVRYLLGEEQGSSSSASGNMGHFPSRLLEVGAYLPRAFVVPEARAADNEDEAMAVLFSGDFDPRTEVIVEGAVPGGPSGGASTDTAGVNITKYTPNQVNIDVDSDGGFLVLSDTHYPGWRAYVDGRESQILIANYNFRAVALGAGRHSIIFRYEPYSFTAGLLLSAFGVLVLAVMIALWVRDRRNYSKIEKGRTPTGRDAPTGLGNC